MLTILDVASSIILTIAELGMYVTHPFAYSLQNPAAAIFKYGGRLQPGPSRL